MQGEKLVRISTERRPGLRLFALSFAALFLELMMIRWAPAAVRFVAYYSNLMLISSFLGLGMGAMLAGRRRNLIALFPIILAIDVAVLTFCHQLLTAPTSESEVRFFMGVKSPLFAYFSLVSLFVGNTAIFVPLGQEIGRLFRCQPALRAYSFDLGGSLCGTLVFGVFSLYRFSPMIGMIGVAVIFVMATRGGQRFWNLPVLTLILFMIPASTDPAAIWSPYYYVTVHLNSGETPAVTEPLPNLRTMMDPPFYIVRVNTDFYQCHGTLDLRRYSVGPGQDNYAQSALWMQHFLCYRLHPNPSTVCVVGAGGGLDAEAALLSGAKSVDAVEIDPVLVDLSHRFSAADIYSDPRVKVHVDDGRAFLQSAQRKYDMVVFGLLDSQALFSSSSNIRLDGYIYTVQCMQRAYSLLESDGVLSVSFLAAKPWLADKLKGMLRAATGRDPIVYRQAGNYIMCVPANDLTIRAPANFGTYVRDESPAAPVDLPTDDWPFLYLSHRTIPADYLAVIGTLLLFSVAGIFALRLSADRGNPLKIGASEAHFFFMGMGFLLLETKSIGDCSLYFGTTWLVTMIVVTGVLLMVLAANLVAMRLRRSSLALYIPVLVSLIALYLIPRDEVLGFPWIARLLWALLCVPLPIFFAGLIFSTTFRDGKDAATLLGANLLGATVGGFCEYLGMAVGVHALMLIVMGAYVASLLCRLAGDFTRHTGDPSKDKLPSVNLGQGEIDIAKGR